MKVMIDTNIVLDVLLRRDPFYDASADVLRRCEEKKLIGFISASAATDIFYLLRRALHDTEETYRMMGELLRVVKILTVSNADVLEAFMQHARDFEDCLLATCAKNNGCKSIVTRNGKDFEGYGINLVTPDTINEVCRA